MDKATLDAMKAFRKKLQGQLKLTEDAIARFEPAEAGGGKKKGAKRKYTKRQALGQALTANPTLSAAAPATDAAADEAAADDRVPVKPPKSAAGPLGRKVKKAAAEDPETLAKRARAKALMAKVKVKTKRPTEAVS